MGDYDVNTYTDSEYVALFASFLQDNALDDIRAIVRAPAETIPYGVTIKCGAMLLGVYMQRCQGSIWWR